MRELEVRHRRWNAAVLQRHLRRRAQEGSSTHPGDLLDAALDLHEELLGMGSPAELLQQALMDLVLMGLIAVTPHPLGGNEWRPVDVPASYRPSAAQGGFLEVRP